MMNSLYTSQLEMYSFPQSLKRYTSNSMEIDRASSTSTDGFQLMATANHQALR